MRYTSFAIREETAATPNQLLQSSPAAGPASSRQHSETHATLSRLGLWAAVALLGFLGTWTHRYDLNPDGISYIEIGHAGISDWHGFVNGYWSPFYPFLLSLLFRWFRPSAFWEYPAVHFVNFAIYLAGYACFELLVSEFLLARRLATPEINREDLLSGEQFRICAAIFYVWASRFWLGTDRVLADFLVSVIFSLLTVMLLRIRRGAHDWLTFLLFGVLLALGYLAKAPMFLLGFAFLFAAWRLLSGASFPLSRAAVAMIAFLTVSLPWIAALSRDQHRLTFGDSAAINYAEYVDRIPLFVHWQGEDPGTGFPLHSTRRALKDPPMFEFATPIPGSYPPWRDPSYWYEGVRPHFYFRGEAFALFRTANEYLKMFSRSGALWCILLLAICLHRQGAGFARSDYSWWPVLLPSFAAFALYSVVHAETRFLTGPGLVLLLWPLSRAQIPTTLPDKRRALAVIVLFVAPTLGIAWSTIEDLRRLTHPQPFVAWNAAQGLHSLGIGPGAKIGYLGSGLETYWAHLAGVQIVADIPDPGWTRFAVLDAGGRQAVMEKFSQIGAVAVVTRRSEIARDDARWQPLPETNLFVFLLSQSGSHSYAGAVDEH